MPLLTEMTQALLRLSKMTRRNCNPLDAMHTIYKYCSVYISSHFAQLQNVEKWSNI